MQLGVRKKIDKSIKLTKKKKKLEKSNHEKKLIKIF
jgi:hypothetical protein